MKNKRLDASVEEAFKLGLNFAAKSLGVTQGEDGTEQETLILEGYANFSGNCSEDLLCFIDRTNDVIVPGGIDLDSYKKSPVVLFQHNRDYVIGKALTVTPLKDGLYVRVEIHSGAMKDEDFYAIKNGLYTSFSIGFRTKAGEWKEIGDADVFFITKSELLEISVVSIPCNTNSTFNIVKAFGELGFSAADVESGSAAPVDTTSQHGEDNMKIKMRDLLPEDKVKEMEGFGLGAALDELKEVEPVAFIKTLVGKLVAEALAAKEAAEAEKDAAAEEQKEDASEESEKDAAAEEQKEAEVPEDTVKAFADTIAELKAHVGAE